MKPSNPLEKEFLALVKKHKSEIADAYAKVIKLSDKYGIPVGAHIPEKFVEEWYRRGGDIEVFNEETQEWEYVTGDIVSLDFAESICDVDGDVWNSSTTDCEIFHG